MDIQEIKLPTHPKLHYKSRRLGRIKRTVIHHTATELGQGQSEIAHVRAIARGHIRKGWPGIGYHFIIGPSGTIYRGNPIKRISYHADPFNESSVGVALIGKLHRRDPSLAQVQAASLLVKELGYEVVPHKKLYKTYVTACPGRWDRWGGSIISGNVNWGRFMRVGIHLPNDGGLDDSDYRLFEDSGITLYKDLVRLDQGIGAVNVEHWKRLAAGADDEAEFVLRLYADMRSGPPSAAQFLQLARPRLIPVLNVLEGFKVHVEVHNEPNHVAEGWGPTEHGANVFKDWYRYVALGLQEFRVSSGNNFNIMFPGLAVAEWSHLERTWACMNRNNIMGSDTVGVHCYWQDHPGKRVQIDDRTLGKNWEWYADRVVTWSGEGYGSQRPVYVTECGSANCHSASYRVLTPSQQAEEYVYWCREAHHRVSGVSFFMYKGSPEWAGFRVHPETVLALGRFAQWAKTNS